MVKWRKIRIEFAKGEAVAVLILFNGAAGIVAEGHQEVVFGTTFKIEEIGPFNLFKFAEVFVTARGKCGGRVGRVGVAEEGTFGLLDDLAEDVGADLNDHGAF